MRLDILYEDNHLLVVNKAAGVVSQGASPDAPSLVKAAKQYLKEKYSKPHNVYLGIVSRLDAQATGVIVFARTSKAARRLSQQFRERTVGKTYWVLLDHPLERSQGRLENWLRHDESQRRVICCSENAIGSQWATLAYQQLAEPSFGYVGYEIALETGRKHQIRVQLSSVGCPIVGDKKYGSHISFSSGIALHARELRIAHPIGASPLVFRAPPPECWWDRRS